MELTPADRLKVHLLLHYPNVKVKHVQLSETPGFLKAMPYGLIDIRGAGYATGNPPCRLWNELHEHFTHHVEIVKRKNSIPTLIVWNGLVYHLDQSRSFKPAEKPVSRRNQAKRPARSKQGKGVPKNA